MELSFRAGMSRVSELRVLWEDGGLAFCRGWFDNVEGEQTSVLVALPASEHPTKSVLDRLAHEYSLRDVLDGERTVRPLELVRDQDRTMLVFKDPGGESFGPSLGTQMEIARFLRVAIAIVEAIGSVHKAGLIHKDIKPTNFLFDSATGAVRLTGFGIASRLPRERQAAPPEVIAGTLAYMAPEQTGRMNRSIDSRSDLYSCGVSFYQMLTGKLPFSATEPAEWIHCHIARQPVAPSAVLNTIPPQLSAIVMRLLAKTADERYQTALGLLADLRRCEAEWTSTGTITPFALGTRDIPDRLIIPERLYGREPETRQLLAAFDRVVAMGTAELVLLSGYSGIGKSSLVNELQKAMVLRHGMFTSGKFDQNKRNIPYATLAQAFQSLVRPLLGKPKVELDQWCEALSEALGQNAQLILQLVPDLKFVIGEQPPVPDLPPREARTRFQAVIQRFIAVFASDKHPLTLFLDDLQWMDAASLDLLEHLAADSGTRHLLLIGAYRDNELGPSHPLKRMLTTLRSAGKAIEEIQLAPLARNDVGRLIADALDCDFARAQTLARLVHKKTGGNPFFVIQFLSALADDGLLEFDRNAATWLWNLDQVHARKYSDNIIDLMVEKLSRLPVDTQTALQQLACFGDRAETAMLSIALEKSDEDVRHHLWDAIRLELVEHVNGAYKFVHDRIQEAAYSLVSVKSRAATHLRIGRLLVANTPVETREQAIFDIVNQFNRGVDLVSSSAEREQLAEYNLLAGRRAKATTAYASALGYLTAGAALLPADCWDRLHELAFALEINRAECEFLTGQTTASDMRLSTLASKAANTVERAIVECLRIDLYTVLDQTDRVVSVCLDYLLHLGIEWSPHPTDEDVRREYDRIWSLLGDRKVEDLIDLPLMSDPEALSTLDVLTKSFPTVTLIDANFLAMAVCRVINLSLERGHSDASCVAYVHFGTVGGPRFGNYQAAFQFGQLAYDLVEQRGLTRFQARTFHWLAQFVLPWARHPTACRKLTHRAFDAAIATGDLSVAVYSFDILNANLIAAGEPLADAQVQAEVGLEFSRKTHFAHQISVQETELALVKTLRGLTKKFGCLDGEHYSEAFMEQQHTPHPAVYWIRKLQARFFAGDYRSALDAAMNAQTKLWTVAGFFEEAEYHFYVALSLAASATAVPAGDAVSPTLGRPVASSAYSPHLLETLEFHHRKLEAWVANCRETFENRAALISAEIARLKGLDLDAQRLYEQSIHSSRANGFLHNEAIAYEQAAKFYADRGLEEISDLYLRNARYCYLRWGADGKVRQLEDKFPKLVQGESPVNSTSTMRAAIQHLDLATIVKLSEAVSSEIVPEKLIGTLMRTAIEHAGAVRGVLILLRGEESRVEADATTSGNEIAVRMSATDLVGIALPDTIVQYVIRTRNSIILDDASSEDQFSFDQYVLRHRSRSILCLPLIKQGKLIGVLYLENNLSPRVFTPSRVAILELLASQAAISLENMQLYVEIEEREAKIRRLVDANIVGIFIWNSEGRIIEANEAFLQMVGYRKADLRPDGLSWADLTLREWHEHDERAAEALRTTGIVHAYEREFRTNNGSRVPVLIGEAAFGGQRDEGVAFVVDLTERKRAEAEARESERRRREAQYELEHANRVAAIGQLSASIAHEVNQPVAASITNAETALRWLGAENPNLQKAREALGRIADDGRRAADVIGRIRALIKKEPPSMVGVEINETIREVIVLTQGEMTKNGVTLLTRLADGLPLVQGDKVQLQQVILNLIINAAEAMASSDEEPRELHIATNSTDSQSVLVLVADTGPGLASTNYERLFDAFYTTKPTGLGMGLPICRTIIEAHGGQLWASANLPRGAVFQFTVPLLPAE
ncbi:AAA family ATPase [Mesorhizobium sp. M7A.F.Ce.TU.012.03.2.1]|uniref:AAA family ATPase n=2 Tax=unclassified Mesorhizobium TaxID=325217 RepID=UPI0032AFE08F